MIIMVLGACLIASMAFSCYLFESGNRRQKELLDRLMAKDFVEYRTMTSVVSDKRPKRFSMTDENEALIEHTRRKKAAESEALKQQALKV